LNDFSNFISSPERTSTCQKLDGGVSTHESIQFERQRQVALSAISKRSDGGTDTYISLGVKRKTKKVGEVKPGTRVKAVFKGNAGDHSAISSSFQSTD
jgi:hypothetical protein